MLPKIAGIICALPATRPICCRLAKRHGCISFPSGYRTVTPRIVVDDVDAQLDFFRTVFAAHVDVEAGRPAEVHLGDSTILVSAATERDAFAAYLYVYVDDADAAYARAIAAGATTVEAPLDTPYGDRRAMVVDSHGNVFQIAHQIRPE